MGFCSYCGNWVDEGDICSHCGGSGDSCGSSGYDEEEGDENEFDPFLSRYEYFIRQGKTCSIKGDHETAIKFYKEALKSTVMDYGKWDVFCAIAGEYEAMEDYTSAEWYWNKCSELEESGASINTPGRIAERADFLYRRDRLDEASEIYEKALEALKAMKDYRVNSDMLKICARAVSRIIFSYNWSGKNNPEEKYHNELKYAIKKYISTQNDLGDEACAYYLSNAAWELYEGHIVDEALILIDSAIKINPNPPANDYNRKAIMLEGKHQYEEAIKYYDRALFKDRFNETFLNNKAGCIKKDLENKILHNNIKPHDLDLIDKALKILPKSCDNHGYLFIKAEILNQLGEPVKARIFKARLLKNYDEVNKTEKQLEKLKSPGTYINITGIRYYQHFEPFKEGTIVDLIKEPNNPHDKDAIRVEIKNETVGYVANSKYTLIEEVKSATDIKDTHSTQAEVQFILFNEWIIAKLI